VPVHPLPETAQALAALELATGDASPLAKRLDGAAAGARAIAPDCVGLTLSFVHQGVCFTWVTADLEAALDAVRSPAASHQVASVEGGAVTGRLHDGPLDEQRWLTLAAATALAGVSSTLSIPLVDRGQLYGGLDLYGGSATAFDGHHVELAQLFGGWAGGAVTNADLTFSTMARARTAPRVLTEGMRSDIAVGMVMSAHGLPEAAARDRLAVVAERAGVSPVRVADILLAARLP
jgi:GAF domain-containing protein